MKKILCIASVLALIAAGCNKPSQSVTSTSNPANQMPTQNLTAQDTSMDISTWHNFTDSQSGFSFKYPSNWAAVTGGKNFTVCLAESAGSQSCAIGVNIVKAPDERHYTGVASNEDLIKAFGKKYTSQTITKDQKVIHNLHTLKYSVAEETQIFIETASYDYNLSAHNRDEQGNIRSDFDAINKVLNGILTTVQVTSK